MTTGTATRLASIVLMLAASMLDAAAGMIIAHRGAKTQAPENTLAAQRLAYQNGAEAVECDLRYTSDGHAVIMHDHGLERTTNGQGLLRDKPLTEILSLDAGSWFSPQYAGEKVPTLLEMLETAMTYGRKLVIDVKGPGWAPGVRKIVDTSGISDTQVMFLTDSLQMTRDYRRYFPDSYIMQGTTRQPETLTIEDYRNFREAGASNLFFGSSWFITREEVARCKANGLGTSLLNTRSFYAYYYLSIGVECFWASDFEEALSRFSQLESEWQTWLSQKGLPWDSRGEDDPDEDGYSNTLEYILTGNPAICDTDDCNTRLFSNYRLISAPAGQTPLWEWKIRVRPDWKRYCTATLQYSDGRSWKSADTGCCVPTIDPAEIHFRIPASGNRQFYRVAFDFGRAPP